MDRRIDSCTAFLGSKRIASGPYSDVAIALGAHLDREPNAALLIFDDLSGKQIDFDLHGTAEEIAARLSPAADKPSDASSTRGPGRPKLGVVAREVTLLPRHWEWLAAQPGGASVTLRRLVEEARRSSAGKHRARDAQERAYHFISSMAGNLPGFEEASRALFADDRERFGQLVENWPADIRDHAVKLAFAEAA